MIYSTDFKKLAGKINHIDLGKYLNDLHWGKITSKRENVDIYQLEKGDEFFQINLPLNRELRDYNEAMYSAMETISKSERKNIEQIILELLNPVSDIIRFRIISEKNESGSIYIEDAIQLYNNAKKLLVASAMDILNPCINHNSKLDSNTQKLIENFRFGQTEIGSYITSVICPLANISNGEYKQYSLFSDEELCAHSFTRQLTKKLISSIKSIKENIEQSKLEEFINNNSPNGDSISVNFLEALNDMSISNPQNELEITAKWAPTVKKNILDIDAIKLSHDYYNPIKAFAEKYKISKSDEKSFIGKIKSCTSEPDAKKRVQGKIQLVFLDDKYKSGTVYSWLKKEDYDKAVIAHQQGSVVKVTGILVEQGKTRKIESADFKILEN
jgi:hypothetical protein